MRVIYMKKCRSILSNTGKDVLLRKIDLQVGTSLWCETHFEKKGLYWLILDSKWLKHTMIVDQVISSHLNMTC